MKKNTTLFLFFFMLLFVVGCGRLIKSSFDESELNTVPGVMFSEVVQDGNRISYTPSNSAEETIWYDSDIRLEKEKRGKWYRIDPIAEFTAEIYNLPSGSVEEMTLNFDNWKDIESGKYRIIKTFMLTEYNEVRKVEEPGKEFYYVSREFEIEK